MKLECMNLRRRFFLFKTLFILQKKREKTIFHPAIHFFCINKRCVIFGTQYITTDVCGKRTVNFTASAHLHSM